MSFKQLVLDFTYLVSLFRNDWSDNSYSWMAMISMLFFICSIRHWFNVTFRISYPRIHGLLGNLQVSGIICKISHVHTHCDCFLAAIDSLLLLGIYTLFLLTVPHFPLGLNPNAVPMENGEADSTSCSKRGAQN